MQLLTIPKAEQESVLGNFWTMLKSCEGHADDDNDLVLKHWVTQWYQQWNRITGDTQVPCWVARDAAKAVEMASLELPVAPLVVDSGASVTHWMDDHGLVITDAWLKVDGTSDNAAAFNIPCKMVRGKIVPINGDKSCKKCGSEMRLGQALAQTLTGVSDFPGDRHCVTMSVGGPGALVDCMKCVACGWSVTAPVAGIAA